MKLTYREAECCYTALGMRKNWIETGTISLSRNDAIDRGQHEKIQKLSESQVKTVALIDDLMYRMLNEGMRDGGSDGSP